MLVCGEFSTKKSLLRVGVDMSAVAAVVCNLKGAKGMAKVQQQVVLLTSEPLNVVVLR